MPTLLARHVNAAGRGAPPRRTRARASEALSVVAPPCVALKEWASVVQALHAGHQQILLRRGGVREAAFAPLSSAADGFVLLPAKQFHAAAKLFKPGAARPYHGADVAWDPSSADAIPIKSVARVADHFTTVDVSVLRELDPLHIWSAELAGTRLAPAPARPIHVLLLRVHNLRRAVDLAQDTALWGCFSWVELPRAWAADQDELAVEPALGEAAWCRAQRVFAAVKEAHLSKS